MTGLTNKEIQSCGSGYSQFQVPSWHSLKGLRNDIQASCQDSTCISMNVGKYRVKVHVWPCQSPDWQLLVSYCGGSCTALEQSMLNLWWIQQFLGGFVSEHYGLSRANHSPIAPHSSTIMGWYNGPIWGHSTVEGRETMCKTIPHFWYILLMQ